MQQETSYIHQVYAQTTREVISKSEWWAQKLVKLINKTLRANKVAVKELYPTGFLTLRSLT